MQIKYNSSTNYRLKKGFKKKIIDATYRILIKKQLTDRKQVYLIYYSTL
jgi:hypothetical protein